MQFILTTLSLSLSLSLVCFTSASGTCTSSGALSWPPVGDCSTTLRYPTTTQNCRACCMNDITCFQACIKAAGLGKRDVIGENFVGAIIQRRELTSKSRAITLSCVGTEDCYEFTDGSLLCLDLGTGLYHDDVGGNGDYYTGTYTGPDGTVQTGTSTSTATGGSRSSSTRTQTAASTEFTQGTSTKAGTISTGGTTAGSTAASAAASATSRGSGDVLRLGANVGLVGLVAGFVL